jgi:hypothetical protein
MKRHCSLAAPLFLACAFVAAPVQGEDLGLRIEITAGRTKGESSVKASGTIKHLITDKERELFGIGGGSGGGLHKAVKKYHGKEPNQAYVRSKAGKHKLYKKYHWPQIQSVFRVKKAEILEITSKPTIIGTYPLNNPSSHTATFHAETMETVSNSVESNWSSTRSYSLEQEFEYSVKFLGAGGGGKTSMTYTQSFGEGGSETTTHTVGSSQGVSVTLEPGKSAKALLSSSKGTMRVRITYEVFLTGVTACNYNPTYKGHHFWAFNIGSVLRAAEKPTHIEFTEDLEIGYFSNGSVTLED